MKTILTILTTFFFSYYTIAQCDLPEPFTGNTGSNMTVMLTSTFLNSLPIDDEDAYIVALNSNGIVVGSTSVANISQTSIAIWGDDTQTANIVDGAVSGESISFQLINNEVIYDVTVPSPVNYMANGLSVQPTSATVTTFCFYGCTSEWAENYNSNATDDDGSCYLNGCTNEFACNYVPFATDDDGSCTIPGCTDNNYTEYYHQGYEAGCDDGSCSKLTSDMGVSPEAFTTPVNSGSNMTIGFNLSNSTGLQGSSIGAFYDLDGDGINNECIGLAEFQNGFFSMAIWGDDTSTEQLEGALSNDTNITFAVLNANGNVMAFYPIPDFMGYTTNGLTVVTELNFNVIIYGCMDTSYCNYNPDAEEDDGSCAGLPGCIDDHYVEYDEQASCELEGACVQTWQALSSNLQDSLMSTEQQMYDLTDIYMSLDSLFNTLNAAYNILIDNYNDLASDCETMELNMTSQINNLQDSLETYSAPIPIDIIEGWNIIGYTLDENQDVVATLEGIVEYVEIVKNNGAEVYWPEFGFNGIGDFIPGQGYQMKVSQAIDNYYFPSTNGTRIILNPTVPQWAIDMPIESHPNDLRTLVKIVNLLGQEVKLEQVPIGTTLFYLYSDATVEKLIK